MKVAKKYPLDSYTEETLSETEYMNDINQTALENEISVYQRLGRHEGIISCFRTSTYGIEMATNGCPPPVEKTHFDGPRRPDCRG